MHRGLDIAIAERAGDHQCLINSPFLMRILFLAGTIVLFTACTQAPAPPAPIPSSIATIPDTARTAPAAVVPETAEMQRVSSGTTPSAPAVAKARPTQSSAVQATTTTTISAAPTPAPAVAPPVPTPPDHRPWSELLQRHVDAAGKVNYKGFKHDMPMLLAYCDSLVAHPPSDNWSRNERLSYWINAYNAFTVRLIVDNYPLKSILQLDGGKTWDVRRIRLGDKRYSLNQIENEIIRPQFQEPRIHFALNCAARSCPPLFNRAFEADQLEAQLQTRTSLFLNNKDFNNIQSGKLRLSKIFDWYSKDFSDLRAFLQPYLSLTINPNASISFNEYDWDLNE